MRMKLFLLTLAFVALEALIQRRCQRTSDWRVDALNTANIKPQEQSTIQSPMTHMTDVARLGTADYLGGTVIVKGGALPWDPIPVTMTCDGKTRYATNADAKGMFAISAPASPGGAAVKEKNPVADQFTGCAVEAALPGFDSSTLTIANRGASNDANIGTITLSREEGSGGTALSSTTAAAPNDAMKAFEKARGEWLDQESDKAQRDLEKAVKIYPQLAEAWYQLGKIQEVAKSPEAVNSFF